MPNAFQSLFAAIVDDDRAKVKELLDHDPEQLARVSEPFANKHGIHAGDRITLPLGDRYSARVLTVLQRRVGQVLITPSEANPGENGKNGKN